MSFEDALEIAARLPKVDLHLHLDGSILPSFIASRARARGVSEAATQDAVSLREFVDEMKTQMRRKSSDARENSRVETGKNWPIFDWMNRWLQTDEELEEGVFSLATHLSSTEKVRYLEVRFCPALHCLEGLDAQGAVTAACRGFERAKEECGICGGVIVCALRSKPAPHPLDMAKLCSTPGVVGFDVAGAETFALSLPAIEEAVAYCRERGVPVTVHAGELPFGMQPNLDTALDFGVNRIGHGLALGFGDGEDGRLLDDVAAKRISVEVCISSITTATRLTAYAKHPIKRMRDKGIRCVLGCDNLTLSGDPDFAGQYPMHHDFSYAYPSGELAHLHVDCGLPWVPDIRDILLDSARAGFASDQSLVDAFQTELDAALHAAGLLPPN